MAKVRFQFDMEKSKAEELEKIVQETGVGTKKELFNNALTLLKWAIKQRSLGRTICSIDSSNKLIELEMPILDAVKK